MLIALQHLGHLMLSMNCFFLLTFELQQYAAYTISDKIRHKLASLPISLNQTVSHQNPSKPSIRLPHKGMLKACLRHILSYYLGSH